MDNPKIKFLWLHLASLRFFLCFLPQYGYVFPDEFFQSSEVMAGDVFNFSHIRTWEWNTDLPIRNIVFPLLSSGLPFALLKLLSSIMNFRISPTVILLAPRVWMTIQSFAVDIIVYKLAYKLYNNEVISCIASTLFASSYVSLVYFTRTFSNCTETILFGLLLCLVTADFGSSNFSNQPSNSKRKADAVFSPTKTSNNIFLISAVLVSGFFIRISFTAYALVPIAYWFIKNLSGQTNVHKFFQGLRTILYFAFCALFSSTIFVLSDTAYFCSDKLLQIPVLVQKYSLTEIIIWLKTLPLTPLNCLIYNMDPKNWEKHGVHPYFLHFVVNLPLLFGPFIFTLAPAAFSQNSSNNCQFKIRKILLVLFGLSFAISLIMLSSVGHQEPRYILPLIIPFTVVYSRCFHPISSHKILVLFWISFNLLCFLFYGLLHQGGVVPTMEFLNSLSTIHHEKIFSNKPSNVSVIFYKTYMPPTHLAAIPLFLESTSSFRVIDVAGKPFSYLQETIDGSLIEPSSDVYLVVPSTLPCVQFKKLRQVYNLINEFQSFPHLSIENPPWADDICKIASTSRNNFFIELAQRMLLLIFKVNN